jgi:hypothetical protein
MEKTHKICTKCGERKLKTRDNFGFQKDARGKMYARAVCKSCRAMIRRLTYRDTRKRELKHINEWRKKHPAYSKNYELVNYNKANLACDLQKNSFCAFISCTHHMAQLHPHIFDRNTPLDKQVDFLLCMPYTCIHEVFRDYPDGMTFKEMGSVLMCSSQAAERRVNKAMSKLRKRVTPAEVKFLLDDK